MRRLQSAPAFLIAPLLVFYAYRAIGAAPRALPPRPPVALERQAEPEPARAPDGAKAARELDDEAMKAQQRLSAVFSDELQPADLETSAAKPKWTGGSSPKPIPLEGMVDVAAEGSAPSRVMQGGAVSLADCPGCQVKPAKGDIRVRVHTQNGPRGVTMFVTVINLTAEKLNTALAWDGTGARKWQATLLPGEERLLSEGVRLSHENEADARLVRVFIDGKELGSTKGKTTLECEPGAGLNSVVPKL